MNQDWELARERVVSMYPDAILYEEGSGAWAAVLAETDGENYKRLWWARTVPKVWLRAAYNLPVQECAAEHTAFEVAPPIRCEPGVEHVWKNVPRHLRRGIVRYIDEGVIPGSFLSAVIQNSLREAVFRADPESYTALGDLCHFFYQYAPAGCQGSADKMNEWSKHIISTLHTQVSTGHLQDAHKKFHPRG